MNNYYIPSYCHRLKRLASISSGDKDFLEKVVLKNLFDIKEKEQATLVLYPTGNIDLKDIPFEVYLVLEKILERKARTFFENYLLGEKEDSFSDENLA